jgi:hypothetical protein
LAPARSGHDRPALAVERRYRRDRVHLGGGRFIASDERWPVGAPVELAFTLPSGALVRTRGAVRSSREPTTLLSGGFEELSSEARDHIERSL